MYVIAGATGNTGGVVAERLLAGGEKVRVVGRDPKRLERFVQKGAEPFVAEATDAAALTNAFAGLGQKDHGVCRAQHEVTHHFWPGSSGSERESTVALF